MQCEVCSGPLKSSNRHGVCHPKDSTTECSREYMRRYYTQHRELIKRRSRKQYAEHREQHSENVRRYRDEHREWWRELHREQQNRRRARKCAAPNETIDERLLHQLTGGICGICELPVEFGEHHLDHIIPLSKGGWHVLGNVQMAHPRCNQRKHVRIVYWDNEIEEGAWTL